MPMVIDMETRWVAVGQLGGWPLSAVPTCVPYCHRQSYSRARRVPIPRVHRSARTVFIDVAASEGHCAAVSAAGHVYTWGRGAAGQLGTGSTSTAFVPSLVQSLADAKVRIQAVSCGGEHTLACKRRVTSQRGAADGPRWITAVGCAGTTGTCAGRARSTWCACGWRTCHINCCVIAVVVCAAVSRSGSVWAWGSGEYGATGLGDLETKRVPWVIQTGLTGQTVIQGAFSRWGVIGDIVARPMTSTTRSCLSFAVHLAAAVASVVVV